MPLEEAINSTIRRLDFGKSYVYMRKGDYISHLGFSLSSEEETQKTYVGYLPELDLSSIIEKNNVMTAEFYHHDYSAKALIKPNSLLKLLYNRVISEIAQILPFVSVKNSMYSGMGINVQKTEDAAPTVSPKVFMDYLNPSLISIGAGTIVGEGAKIQAHFFNPGRYVIGEIRIGKKCVVGAGARLLPGTIIRDSVKVGVDSVAAGYVDENVKPLSFYEKF